MRENAKDGWMPLKPSQSESDGHATPANRQKRAEVPDDYEANILIKRHLDEHPKAIIRDVAEAVVLSRATIWTKTITRA